MRRAGHGLLVCLALAFAACGTWTTPDSEEGSAASESEAPLVLPQPDRRTARPWLVALVSVGGLTSAAWEGPDPAMPLVARLVAQGASSGSVEPVAPASHTPAHATLVTGRTPALHRIAAERRLTDRGVAPIGYAQADLFEGPTLWSAAAAANRQVAALGWPTTIGASIPALLPDVGMSPRISWLAALSGKATPRLIELARQAGGDAPGTATPGAARDRVLVDVACALVTSPAPPNLLLLHLGQVRLPVARDGPGTPAVRAAFAAADADLERLLTCLSRVSRLEGVALIVVGDHGSLPAHTALAPNTLLEAAGLLSRQAGRSELRDWGAIARSNGGSAFVYARAADPAVRARRELLREAESGGPFRVVGAEELLQAGADPEAWFGLEAQPGYHFVDDVGVLPEAASALRGSGGYLPGRPEMAPGFVAWGRGVRAGVRVPWMQQVDVAPTVARLLGIGLPEAQGRPLAGILNVPATPELATRLPFEDEHEEDGNWRSSPAGP